MNNNGIKCLGDNGICVPLKTYSYEKKKTNADKIRTMSDEELAEFFIHTKTNCELCNCLTNECLMDCSNGILEWLKSEAEQY